GVTHTPPRSTSDKPHPFAAALIGAANRNHQPADPPKIIANRVIRAVQKSIGKSPRRIVIA
ncbi:MAG TPA: hypothetical protein VGM07_15335, partial [Stellaceae bacterium]